jgi:hypothetical protein
MNLPVKIVLASLGSILLYGVGLEVKDAPRPVQVPAGVALVRFSDLAGAALPEGAAQPRPGDYIKVVPREVLKLDQQRVVVQGYMIPTVSADRMVREFLLVRSQANCCFGFPLQIGDVLEVRMTGRPAEPLKDRPVNVVGTFHVQEHWAGTSLGSLYQMDAESVSSGSTLPPLKLARTPQAGGLE